MSVEAFLDQRSLSAEEAAALGRWLLKTWLLLSHPQTHYEIPDQFKQDEYTPERWAGADDSLFSWLVAEAEEPAPSDLSIWAFREDPNTTVDRDDRVHIPLPTVTVDEVTHACRSRNITVEGINVTLVSHPGWNVDHLLEREGRAVRLWPTTGEEVEIANLPLVAADEVRFLKGPRLRFENGRFPNASQPSLSETTDFSPGLSGLTFSAW